MNKITVEKLEREILKINKMKEMDDLCRKGVVMLACSIIGPSLTKLTKFTKYNKDLIKLTLRKMKENKILTKDNKLVVEWFDKNGRMSLLCDMMAVEGLVKRTIK